MKQSRLYAHGTVHNPTYNLPPLSPSLSYYFSSSLLSNPLSPFPHQYFYWMFESRSEPSTDPFILWMTGGPGCSGQLALLNENGPCSVAKDGSGNLATVTNPYSWTNKATVLWIDQPTGVGFSYGDSGDYDHDEAGIRDDMYHFLLEFFAENPEYAKLPFYVFGESYGGHFAPNVAYRVWEGNNNATKSGNGADVINLQGLAVGNGLTDPSIQYQW